MPTAPKCPFFLRFGENKLNEKIHFSPLKWRVGTKFSLAFSAAFQLKDWLGTTQKSHQKGNIVRARALVILVCCNHWACVESWKHFSFTGCSHCTASLVSLCCDSRFSRENFPPSDGFKTSSQVGLYPGDLKHNPAVICARCSFAKLESSLVSVTQWILYLHTAVECRVGLGWIL